jgi:hypothetical protein
MPQLLFPTVGRPNARSFVRGYHVGKVYGEKGQLLLKMPLDTVIYGVAGIGDEVRGGDFLRLYAREWDGKELEKPENLRFECCQVLLQTRKLDPHTAIKTAILLPRDDELLITVDLQMYIWLFGDEQPRNETCPHCGGRRGEHVHDCPSKRWPTPLQQTTEP